MTQERDIVEPGSSSERGPVRCERDGPVALVTLDVPEELNALSKQGRWDDMTAAVSDDLLHLMSAVGRHDQLAAALAERFAGVTDVITVATPLPPDLIQDIQRL